MPYIGNNPKVTELNVSTKSVDILADVDTVSDAPEIGQVLKWNGTNWVPEDDTGTGGGTTTSDLQGVTDNGSSTTNTIDAAGFKLNADQLSSVAGTQGDIKKIGGLPYYHDGTAWKRFYLFDNVEDATTVDVNWDDVQVRLDFEEDTSVTFAGGIQSRNYVNRLSPRAVTYSSATDDISIVSSPVKFGTKSLKVLNVSKNSELSWVVGSEYNPIYNDIYLGLDTWTPEKRGGCIDWSGDWTVEFWIYFPTNSLSASNIGGIYTGGLGSGYGIFHNREGTSTADPSFGLVFDIDAYLNRRLWWHNSKTDTQINLMNIGYTGILENTWYHIAVSRDGSSGRIAGFLDGVYANSGIDTSVWDHQTAGYETSFGKFYAPATNNFNEIDTGANYFIDDLRITQFRRYTYNNNFTAPTAAYPIAPPAPSSIDDDWSDVEFRMTFDTNFNDISPNSYTGTTSEIGVLVSNSTVKYGTGSLAVSSNSFEGLKVGEDIDTTGSWTFEGWFNFNSLPGWQYSAILWSNGYYGSIPYSTSNIAFGVYGSSSNNNVFNFWWYSDLTKTYLAGSSLYDADLLNKWVHIAVTRDSVNGAINMYFNGYKVSRLTNSGLYDLATTTVTHYDLNKFHIGGKAPNWAVPSSFGGLSAFDGHVDDVRFTNSVRYTDNFTPPTGPLGTTGSLTTSPIPASSGEGSIALGTTPGWNGTTGWTVQRSQAGIYRVTFSGTFASSQSYVVHATINDGPTSPCHVRVIRYSSYFDIVVTQISDGTAVDTGYVAVRLLDLATV